MPHSGVCVPLPKCPHTCVKCGKPIPEPEPGMPRDVSLERELSYVARQAAGLPVPPYVEDEPYPVTPLAAYAESRARPGNVDTDHARDLLDEAREEAADLANYVRWRCQQLQQAYLAGDSEACREYAMGMRALQYAELAYDALCVPPQ